MEVLAKRKASWVCLKCIHKIENHRTSKAIWKSLCIRSKWDPEPAGAATRHPAEFHLDSRRNVPCSLCGNGAFVGWDLAWFFCPHFSALTDSLFHVWPALFSSLDFWMCPCCHDYKSLVSTQLGFWSQLLHIHTARCSVPSFGFIRNIVCTYFFKPPWFPWL